MGVAEEMSTKPDATDLLGGATCYNSDAICLHRCQAQFKWKVKASVKKRPAKRQQFRTFTRLCDLLLPRLLGGGIYVAVLQQAEAAIG